MTITCGIYLYDLTRKQFIICHATHASWNQWSIPKGLKEKNEDTLTAATRELWEETGIKAADLHIIDTHILAPVKYMKRNKTIESFLVITDTSLTDFKPQCKTFIKGGFPEIDNWKWVDIDTMAKMVHESQKENIPLIKKLLSHAGTNSTQ